MNPGFSPAGQKPRVFTPDGGQHCASAYLLIMQTTCRLLACLAEGLEQTKTFLRLPTRTVHDR